MARRALELGQLTLMPARSTTSALAAAFLALAPLGHGQSADLLPELVVLAERRGLAAGAETRPGDEIAAWTRDELRAAAPRTVDELLAREPSFSLYRRQTAMFGNPTSAGVSLRDTGASAASRTLVLLDGIPQNDPFGGWVYWGRYEASALESLRIVPSARAAVWGNQSPAGVVQLARRDPFEPRSVLRLAGGGQGTWSAAAASGFVAADGRSAVSLSTFGLESDGFFAVGPDQRGEIDRRLDLALRGIDLWLARESERGLRLEAALGGYAEERGNGTPLARNASEALDFSLRASLTGGPLSWQALVYHQRREFDQVFSSVDAARRSETLALDQFDVPGRGTGGALVLQWQALSGWTLGGGADLRHLRGETRERVGLFRERRAGGEQTVGGLFFLASRESADLASRLDASLRLDFWQVHEGRRLERALADGALLRDDALADRDGFEPSLALAAARDWGGGLEGSLSLGSSFRLPTLNELHRPFRVRNDIVEANPALDPERFLSLEGWLEWSPEASPLELRLGLFHHWIRDAIANVPVTDPGEIAALFGSLPPGGSGSRRANVDRARVAGLQAGLAWRPAAELELSLDGRWSDTRFARSSGQPLLEGRPFPQAPDLRLSSTLEWRPLEALSLFGGVDYGAHQFDDALARRRIPSYASTRVGLALRHGPALYQLRVDNLFDRRISTGLSSDGIRTLAAPRSLWAAVELEF